MIQQIEQPIAYTPEQVATLLQLSKQTVYGLIKNGEIVAKKLGKTYRIPRTSLSFVFTGLDEDLLQAQKEDLRSLVEFDIENTISQLRKR